MGEQKRIKAALNDLGKDLGNDNTAIIDDLLKKFVGSGSTPKDILGISDEKSESIYANAYLLYNTGKYGDAIHLFRLLIMMDPSEIKYILGLSACFHMQKEYRKAVDTYSLCAAMDTESPIPYFHLSDCFLQLQDKPSALIALEMAVQRAGDKIQYQILKDRALLTIDSLKKDFEKIKVQQEEELG